MTTIAALGLSVDSSSVDKGTKSLDKLNAASKALEAQTHKLNNAQAAHSKMLAKGPPQQDALRASLARVAAAESAVFRQRAALAAVTEKSAAAEAKYAAAANGSRIAQAAMTKSSNMLAFRQRQLAVQSLDVAQSLALGIPPMMVAVQQGGQIAGIYAGQGGVAGAFREATGAVLGFVGKHPILTAATAAIGIGFAGVTAEINKSSDTAVSFGNVVRASLNVAASGIKSVLAPAISAISPAFAAAWNGAVGFTKSAINTIIGAAVGAYKFIVAEWDNLPAAFGSLAIKAGQAFIDGIAAMLRKAAKLYNDFLLAIQSKFRERGAYFPVPTIDAAIYAPTLKNPFGGAGSGGAGAFQEAFNNDYVGQAYGAVRDEAVKLAQAQDEAAASGGRAGDAIKAAADKGKDAWKGLRKTTSDYAKAATDALSGLGEKAGGIFRGLIDGTLDWKDAAMQAINSVLSYLNKMNVAKGGSGIFGGGFFQSLLGGFLGVGFSKGGYTGGSSTREARGIVHGKEFVANAAATARYRPQLEAMNAGRAPANFNSPQAANQNVNVTVSVDENGNLQAFVAQEAQATVRGAAPAIVQASVRETNKNLPKMIGNAQARKL